MSPILIPTSPLFHSGQQLTCNLWLAYSPGPLQERTLWQLCANVIVQCEDNLYSRDLTHAFLLLVDMGQLLSGASRVLLSRHADDRREFHLRYFHCDEDHPYLHRSYRGRLSYRSPGRWRLHCNGYAT